MKRFLAVFLMLAILLTGLTVTANAATTGWKKLDDGTWTYVKADGKLAENEWIKDGSKWYYFDGTTMVANNVCKVKGKWYVFDKNGAMADNGWFKLTYEEGSDWYYAGADGALAEGWKKIDGKWYYLFKQADFDGAPDWIPPFMFSNTTVWFEKSDNKYDIYAFDKSGAMISNAWFKEEFEIGHSWYYLGTDGLAKKGWIKDNGKWYYLDANYAYMYADGMETMSDGNTYAFEKSGAMVTGWKKFGSTWYYFKDSGAMLKSDWVKGADGKWYYLKENGEMAANETLTIKGKEYKFDANGAWIEK